MTVPKFNSLENFFKFILNQRNRNLIFFIIALVIYLLFLHTFNDLIRAYIVPVLSKCEKDLKNDIIFFLLFMFSIFNLFWKISNEKSSISRNGLFISIILILLYIPHRFNLFSWQNWEYTSFSVLDFVKYFDIIIILIILLILNLSKKWHKVPSNSERSFLEDNHSTFENQDLLKRERLALEIADYITGTSPKNSFAIGIMGNWGSGKTIFLKQVSKYLNDSCIKVHFNPWRSNDSKLILQDFFSSLTNELKSYDPYLSKQMEKYSKALISSEDSIITKILRPFFQSIYPDNSLQEQFCSIQQSLDKFDFKVVIFIDDLDRLDGEEILEVLRIIRNTVDFPNTFFLAAYEQNYILKSIEKSKIPEVNRYLEKIFQLEITLPSHPEIFIRNALLTLFKKNRPLEDYKQLEDTISLLSNISEQSDDILSTDYSYNLIQDHLHNLRDVVRLVNSFNLNYNFKKEEVDLVDFMVIELIKLKYYNVYLSIADQLTKGNYFEFFSMTGGFGIKNKKLKFDIEKFKLYWEKGFNPKDFDFEVIARTINCLFNRDRKTSNMRSIIFAENSLLYFSCELYDKISFRDFKSARKGSLENFVSSLDKWIQEDKQEELIRIFTATFNYEGKEDFEKMIYAMIHLNKLDTSFWRNEIFTRLAKVDYVANNYYNRSIQLYKKFILQLFENAKYPFVIESSIAYDFLYPLLNKDSSIKGFFTIDELKNVILNFLKSYCKSEYSKEVTIDSFMLYYNNQLRIDQVDRRITLSPPANTIFKKFVEKNMESYVRNLIRPYFTPHDGKTFVLEPFISQTFGSYENFETKLMALSNTQTTLEVKTFYTRYKENTFKPIEFERNKIELYSNDECEFLGSNKYPKIKQQKTVKCFIHPYSNKILANPAFYDFRFAKWIAHKYPVDTIQATEGGDYLLRYKFYIDEPTKRMVSYIKLFVDDACQLKVNERIISNKIETGNINQLAIEDIKCFTNKIPIRNGENILTFKILNKTALEIDHSPDEIITGYENPYGIIFIIQINFEP